MKIFTDIEKVLKKDDRLWSKDEKNKLLKNKLVDELMLFTAPKIMGNGIDTFADSKPVNFANAKEVYYELSGDDLLMRIVL